MSAVLVMVLLAQTADVRSTKHNLSAGSVNSIKASAEDQVCVFCHIPHGASQSRAVWNRDLSEARRIVEAKRNEVRTGCIQPELFDMLKGKE